MQFHQRGPKGRIDLILLNESINHPPSETIQMETMTLNKDQEAAIMQAKVDRLTTQLIAELVEQLEKIGATEDTPIRCLGNKPLSELKEWLGEEELVTIYPKSVYQIKDRKPEEQHGNDKGLVMYGYESTSDFGNVHFRWSSSRWDCIPDDATHWHMCYDTPPLEERNE